MRSVCPGLLGLVLLLGVGGPTALADDPPGPARPAAPRARGRTKAAPRPARRDEPPACPNHRVAAAAPRRPPARSMPELFDRMMDGLARNPANAFQEALAGQEGAALEAVRLTPAEERRIGRQARDAYLQAAAAKGFRRVDEADRLGYLRDLVAGLARHMKNRARYPDIEVSLIRSPIADGQSFPGGFLVFTTGLLDEPDEATVAGVVAHELAHLDLGHLNEYARRSKLAETAFTTPPGPGLDFEQFFLRGAGLMSLMMNPFRPEHEAAADCAATTWLYLEGYDPAGLIGFFVRLHERMRDQPDHPFFRFGRTHPFSLDRRDHVRARLVQLQRWKRRDDLGLYPENLRRFVARSRDAGRPEAAGR